MRECTINASAIRPLSIREIDEIGGGPAGDGSWTFSCCSVGFFGATLEWNMFSATTGPLPPNPPTYPGTNIYVM